MKKNIIIAALVMSFAFATSVLGATENDDFAGESLGKITESKGNIAELYYIEEADVYVIYDPKAKDRWIPLPKTTSEMSISYDGDDIPISATVSMDATETEEDDEPDEPDEPDVEFYGGNAE